MLFADGYNPLQSLKFLQKFDHYILRKLVPNIANVVITAVRKRVPPLYVAPPSEHIVKPTWDVRTVRLSIATVLITANSAVMRCVERPQCGAKLAVFREFSQSNFARNSTKFDDASYNGNRKCEFI